jgi:hypothetical protein
MHQESPTMTLLDAWRDAANTEVRLKLQRAASTPTITQGRVINLEPDPEKQGKYRFILRSDDGTLVRFAEDEVIIGSIEHRNVPVVHPTLPSGSESPVSIARAAGIQYLLHSTPLLALDGIFESKTLKTNAPSMTPTSYPIAPGVYMEAYGPSVSGKPLTQYIKERVSFVFDLGVLEGRKFHASRGWTAGYILATSASATEPQKLFDLFWEVAQGITHSNEVVFSDELPIETAHLQHIWVSAEPARAALVEFLRDSDFHPKNGLPVDQFVETRTMFPKID